MAQQRRVTESGPLGDAVDVEIGLLEHPPRVEHALVGDPLHRRGPGLLDEPAGERARRHVRAVGQGGDGMGLVEVRQNPIQLRGKPFRASRRDRLVDVLALTAVALRRHHHPAGDDVRDGTAQFAAYQVQAGVDTGGGARAGDQVTVVDEQDIAVDDRGRIAAGPARRRASSAWCSGRPSSSPAAPATNAPEHTVRMVDPAAAAALSASSASWRIGSAGPVTAGTATRSAPSRPSSPWSGTSCAPTLVRSGRPASGPHTLKSKFGHTVGGAVDAEHLADHPELEHREAVENERRDGLQSHGRILSQMVSPATVGWICVVEELLP